MINENVGVLPWVVELDPDLVVNILSGCEQMYYLKDLPQFLPPVTVFNGVARVD